MHAVGAIGIFDAAVVENDGEKVHVHKTEKPTQHGAWAGIGVGALIGILFPPSILAGAVVGGTAGGVIGHLRKGMPRGEPKDFGETLGAASSPVLRGSRTHAYERPRRDGGSPAHRSARRDALVDLGGQQPTTRTVAVFNDLREDGIVVAGNTIQVPTVDEGAAALAVETVPVSSESLAGAEPVGDATHLVAPGETLSAIAAVSGVSSSALAGANGRSAEPLLFCR